MEVEQQLLARRPDPDGPLPTLALRRRTPCPLLSVRECLLAAAKHR